MSGTPDKRDTHAASRPEDVKPGTSPEGAGELIGPGTAGKLHPSEEEQAQETRVTGGEPSTEAEEHGEPSHTQITPEGPQPDLQRNPGEAIRRKATDNP